MTYLLIIILMLAIAQPAGNQRVACVTFASSIFLFDIFCGDMPGDDYFFAAALNSSICYILLSKLKPNNLIIYALQVFCGVSIFLNSGGYLFYVNWKSGTPYEMAFYVFHGLIILLFIYGGPVYGHFKGDRNIRRLSLSYDMGGYIHRETTL